MYNPLDSVIEIRNPSVIDSHWQLPNTPLHLEFSAEYIEAGELKQIAKDLDLSLDELESLEVFTERTKGNVDYILVNEIQYQCIEDLPESIKTFLDNVQFGDPEDPVISATGARISYWDTLSGEPEVQQAFFDSGYDPDSDYFHIEGNYDVVDSLQSMEEKLDVKLQDGLETQIINLKVKNYIEDQDVKKKKSFYKKLILFSFMFVSILTGIIVINNYL